MRPLSFCAALALAGVAQPAAATVWPGDGLSLMFAAMARDDAGEWMMPRAEMLANMASVVGLICVDESGSVACIGMETMADLPDQSPGRSTFGIILADDGSRCITRWRGRSGPEGYSDAEINRLFFGPETTRNDDLTLAWDAPPGPYATQSEVLMADADALLQLCLRMTPDMVKGGKVF